MKTPLIVANWKSNGSKEMLHDYCAEVDTYVSAHSLNFPCVICPPLVYLQEGIFHTKNPNIHWGTQDCSATEEGAFTGDVTAPMIQDMGGSCVIVGHSERRANHAEANLQIGEKVGHALRADLTPILCFGEPLDVFERGDTAPFCAKQLKESLLYLKGDVDLSKVVLAYEPIWAIGSGKTPEAKQVQNILKEILQSLQAAGLFTEKVPVFLYGGSVSHENIADFLQQNLVSGALVGGASLKPETFLPLLKMAAKI